MVPRGLKGSLLQTDLEVRCSYTMLQGKKSCETLAYDSGQDGSEQLCPRPLAGSKKRLYNLHVCCQPVPSNLAFKKLSRKPKMSPTKTSLRSKGVCMARSLFLHHGLFFKKPHAIVAGVLLIGKRKHTHHEPRQEMRSMHLGSFSI